jgi:branched-chain amino acid transport system substrate-binding protein
MKKILLVLVSLLIVLSLISVAEARPGLQEETIRIGGIGPLSRPGAAGGGAEMLNAMKVAASEINEAGGVLGMRLELIFADTEGLPERGVAAVERLITENKVVGIVGEYHSAVGLAIMEVLPKYGVPVIFAETWSDEITAQHLPQVFRIAPTSTMNAQAVGNWIEANGWSNVVIITEDTDYGIKGAEKATADFEGRGMKVETLMGALDLEDWMPILLRIQEMDPLAEAIYVLVTGEGSYRVESQMIEIGLAPTAETALIANQVAYQPEYWESVPGGVYVTFPRVGLSPALYNEKTEAFITKYEELYNRPPPSYAMEAYDSVYLMVQAIEDAGSTDPEAIIEALENIDYVGVQGRYYFPYGQASPVPDDEPDWMYHQWPDPAVLLLEYTEVGQGGGEAAVIWPETYKTQDEIYIAPE